MAFRWVCKGGGAEMGFPEDCGLEELMKRNYGWNRDSLDFRDYKLTAPVAIKLPPLVDLRGQMPQVYDQGPLGSCVGNGIAAAHQFDQLKQQEMAFPPSRLFIYFNARDMEGTTDQDAGASIRDGMKSIAKQGVCPEIEWPYDVKQFKNKPGPQCYKDALNHQGLIYMRVPQTLDQLKGILASGFPIVGGISVYDSFESKTAIKTGNVPMPQRTESCLGGHCILLCGFNDKTKRFIFRNSWGVSYGQKGYGTIPYEYVCNSGLASDFWVLKLVE
jgi:C1A family cysteine protease